MNAIEPLKLPLAFRLLHRFEAYLARHSIHGDPVFYDPAAFDWAPELEAACEDIRAEYRQLLTAGEPIPPFHEVSREQLSITSDGLWRTFILYAYGIQAERNCALCPRTVQAVRAVPGMQTAMFSILAPGQAPAAAPRPVQGLAEGATCARPAAGPFELLDRGRRHPPALAGRQADGVRRHLRPQRGQ
jgi:beta-hydroxylase